MNRLVIYAVKEHLAQLKARSQELQAWIDDAEKGAVTKPKPKPRESKRVFSPEARARMADAQKKRWAAFRKEKVA